MSEVRYWWVWRPSLSKVDMGALHYHKVVLASDYDRECADHAESLRMYRSARDRADALQADLAEMRRQRDTAIDELRNIANATPREWDPDCRDQFQQWAQSRARHTLAALTPKEPRDG